MKQLGSNLLVNYPPPEPGALEPEPLKAALIARPARRPEAHGEGDFWALERRQQRFDDLAR
jgi:hypothetical protein